MALARSNARNSGRMMGWAVSTNPAIGTAPSVVGNLVLLRSSPTMSRSSNRWLGAGPYLGITQIVLAVSAREPIQQLAIRTQCDPSTVWRICRRYEDSGPARPLGTTPPRRTTGADFPPPPAGTDRSVVYWPRCAPRAQHDPGAGWPGRQAATDSLGVRSMA